MNETSFSEACHADYSEMAVLQCVHLHGRLEASVRICGHGIKKTNHSTGAVCVRAYLFTDALAFQRYGRRLGGRSSCVSTAMGMVEYECKRA